MKFILIENEVNGYFHYYCIIFSKTIVHLDMYLSQVELLRKYGDCTKIRCVSAGEYNEIYNVYGGESISLNIGCHGKTKDVIFKSNYIQFQESQFTKLKSLKNVT